MAAEGYTVEELARDQSDARRRLENAQANLWDIDHDELMARERRRLSTINSKIGELCSIIEDREVQELREDA